MASAPRRPRSRPARLRLIPDRPAGGVARFGVVACYRCGVCSGLLGTVCSRGRSQRCRYKALQSLRGAPLHTRCSSLLRWQDISDFILCERDVRQCHQLIQQCWNFTFRFTQLNHLSSNGVFQLLSGFGVGFSALLQGRDDQCQFVSPCFGLGCHHLFGGRGFDSGLLGDNFLGNCLFCRHFLGWRGLLDGDQGSSWRSPNACWANEGPFLPQQYLELFFERHPPKEAVQRLAAGNAVLIIFFPAVSDRHDVLDTGLLAWQ